MRMAWVAHASFKADERSDPPRHAMPASGADFPEIDGMVAGARCHDRLLGVECHVVDTALVAGELVEQTARVDVPDVLRGMWQVQE